MNLDGLEALPLPPLHAIWLWLDFYFEATRALG